MSNKPLKVLMFIPFHLVLKPLIRRNYRLRALSAAYGDGRYPDVWYWADVLAMNSGYSVDKCGY